MKVSHQMNIVLVAEEAAGVQALRRISNSGHILMGVLTTIDPPGEIAVPNKKPLNSSIVSIASKLGVPVMEASRVQDPDFAAWMNSNHVDVIINVHSLYRICPEVIQAARVGAFNLHPGPLPGYSGLNVPSWAVYNEESTHSVTIHRITEKIDTGHIVYETQFPLTSTDTGLTVSLACAEKGLDLIDRLLSELSYDPLSIPSTPQDLSQRTLYKRDEIPGKGFIKWSEQAHKIDAFVRACNYAPFPSPWGDPKTRMGDTVISILKTTLSNKSCQEPPGTVRLMLDGRTAISTADNWILIDKCKVAGKSVSASSVLTNEDKLTDAINIH